MEDDDLFEPPRKLEPWEIPVDFHVVAEAKARLREFPAPLRKRLLRILDSEFQNFSVAYSLRRQRDYSGGISQMLWIRTGENVVHTGRAYVDVDILSSPEFQSWKGFQKLARGLHRNKSRALSIAASLLILRDASWRDGMSIGLARNLLAGLRPAEAIALVQGEREIKRHSDAGRPGGVKRSKKFRRDRKEVCAAYQRLSKKCSTAEKMEALKQRFPKKPSISSLYKWTEKLRAEDRRKRASLRMTSSDGS